MSYWRRAPLGAGAFVLVSLVLLGFSRTFSIEPAGNIHGTVEFSFYRRGEPVKVRIVEFVVQQQQQDGGWSVVWELRGEAWLDGIEYGVSYQGLEVAVQPEALSPKGRYRVLASELAWPTPMGHSAAGFLVEESGDVMSDALRTSMHNS